MARPSPHSKRWWTSDLTQQLRQLKAAQSRARKPSATAAEREAVPRLWRKYPASIRRQQRRHWREWLEEANEQTVWQGNEYAAHHSESNTVSRIPELRMPDGRMATTSEEKCDGLMGTFFPNPPPARLDDIDPAMYPSSPDAPTFTPQDEVEAEIKTLSPYKAPGPNQIPIVALLRCSKTLSPILWRVGNTCLDLGCHPPRAGTLLPHLLSSRHLERSPRQRCA